MKLTRKDIFYAVLFTTYLLTYMIVLSVSDDLGRAADATGYLSHYYPGITRILGFASFWVSRRFIPREGARRSLLIAAGCIFLISAALLTLNPTGSFLLPILLALSLSLGHLGGLIYYCISVAFSMNSYKGRLIGFSCAASVLLQYILAGHTGVVAQLIIAAAIFLLISYLILKTPANFILEDPLPYSGTDEAFDRNVRRQLLLIIGVIVLCSLLACRTDIAFLSLSYSSDVNIYSYPRLMMLAGYLIMGFAADKRSRSIVGITFFGGVLMSALLILMPFTDGSYSLFLSVYYFFISFYIFFYTYFFISVAPRTHSPELWASMGRPLSDLCSAPVSFIMLRLGSERLNSSPLSYAIYYLLLLIALYILMAVLKPDPNLTDAGSDTHTGEEISLDNLLSAYSLTPRERDVAALLITTELPIKAIAAELGISERSVYRFCSSIYEKTGTDNRIGLVKEFYSRLS
ncbi:MAG: helix-turn-helix transcriptional regulator [Lachnospiraceae bacterium]|nr:helix-turn-helix transcriptional regulator [Lachnospiraceae bacterium]